MLLCSAATPPGAHALLARLGVGARNVVAVTLPNRIEVVPTLFAAWRVGAAVTPVNPALRALGTE